MPKREKQPDVEEKQPATKKSKPSYTFNFNQAVDKAHEGKSFTELLELPPSALQGLAERVDPLFARLHIKTIKDLASWKYYHIAKAIAYLGQTEEPNKRSEGAESNLNEALDKEWETKTFAEILDAPLGAFQGVGDVTEEILGEIRGLKTIRDLANWKYCQWAEAIKTLAQYENSDHSSHCSTKQKK